jgi:hypothetical protein
LDPELLIFPFLSMVAAILFTATFILPIGGIQRSGEPG